MISGLLFPAVLLSFTLLLYSFLQRRVEEWEKVRRTGVLKDDFWEFWRTKADGFTAIGKSTPVHVYWRTVLCVNHVTIIYQVKKQSRRDLVVSKKIKKTERESVANTTRKPLTSRPL